MAGFLALLLSPTPMVRSFGLLLVVGVAIAFGLALTAGFAALSLRASAGGGGTRSERRYVVRGADNPASKGTPARPALTSYWGRPTAAAVLGIGLALATVGWAVGTQIETQSDIRELAPQSIREVRDLNQLQEATGVRGSSMSGIERLT